jgi:hypothetical protein
MQGYFMSDDAEKAAKWNIVEQQREAKEHLLALESEMTTLGEQWLAFGVALKSPGNYVFDITGSTITLGQHNAGLRQPLGWLTSTGYPSWERFSELLTDYQETSKKKADLTAKLREAGFSI